MTGGRLPRRRRASLTRTSREIASHHLMGATVTLALAGPDKNGHILSAAMVLTSFPISLGPKLFGGPAFAYEMVLRGLIDSFTRPGQIMGKTGPNAGYVRFWGEKI